MFNALARPEGKPHAALIAPPYGAFHYGGGTGASLRKPHDNKQKRWKSAFPSTTIRPRIRRLSRAGGRSTQQRQMTAWNRVACCVEEELMKPTDIAAPDYFHKVVDCQWACPAHTPVPEYIRLIAAGRYSDAYMINWESNVFPGHARPHLRPSLRTGLPARAGRRRSRSRSAGSSASPPTSRTTSPRDCPSLRRQRTASASRSSAAAPPR